VKGEISSMRFESYGRRTLAVIVSIFFLSGFSALLYQVAWQRMLGLFSGSDVRSATIVIGAYLAGLGVGSLIGSFFADRLDSRQAVWAFGSSNLGIALFAFLSRLLFYDLLFSRLNTLSRLPTVEFIIVFITLLWPTILMGLSLPLLSKALVRDLANAASLISLLYGINTLGAAVGTLVSGWYLIGTVGYEITVYVGGFLSALVGIIALTLARQFSTRDRDDDMRLVAGSLNLRLVPRSVWMWCLLVFASGFIAISLELIWFRVLDIMLESNAYTFAHLLAFILFGYAVGSLCGASYFVRRLGNPRRVFLWIQGFVTLYSVLAIWGIAAAMGHDFLGGSLTFSRGKVTPTGFSWSVGYIFLPTIMLLPPNLLIGFYFPIVQKAVQTDEQLVGQRVSLIQVANIVGNVAGSILTGLFLLHFLGTAGSLRVISVLGLLFVCMLIRESFPVFKQPGKIVSGLLASALFISFIFFPDATTFWSQLHHAKAGELFIVAEDSSGIAALREKGDLAEMYANGERQGTVPYLRKHITLGALPALVHPDPKRVLVIGIGSGGTPYAVGINPRTEHIVAVEILGAELPVLEAYAAEEKGRPLKALFDDERYEIVVGDGRRELALSDTKFDIIEADAIYPWRSRSGLLYSKEFFEEARAKLADGGIMAQWSPTSRTEATFLNVFPYVLQFDDILLGSNRPIDYAPQAIPELFMRDPHFVEYLNKGRVHVSVHEIIGELSATWTPDTPRESDDINTDLFPRDEYYLNNH
jgi:spermidine synthase